MNQHGLEVEGLIEMACWNSVAALLSGEQHDLFGQPKIQSRQYLQWTACWNRDLGKGRKLCCYLEMFKWKNISFQNLYEDMGL